MTEPEYPCPDGVDAEAWDDAVRHLKRTARVPRERLRPVAEHLLSLIARPVPKEAPEVRADVYPSCPEGVVGGQWRETIASWRRLAAGNAGPSPKATFARVLKALDAFDERDRLGAELNRVIVERDRLKADRERDAEEIRRLKDEYGRLKAEIADLRPTADAGPIREEFELEGRVMAWAELTEGSPATIWMGVGDPLRGDQDENFALGLEEAVRFAQIIRSVHDRAKARGPQAAHPPRRFGADLIRPEAPRGD